MWWPPAPGPTWFLAAAEHGWLEALAPGAARAIRWVAWGSSSVCLAVIVVGVTLGSDLEAFLGGGTWQLGLVISCGLGMLLVRVPGLSRVL